MARKLRRRSRRRRTRKRRGGTNLFGKDQNHETLRMRLERMEKNMEKEKQYQEALKSSRSMPVDAKRSAFAKGSKGQATRNIFKKEKPPSSKDKRKAFAKGSIMGTASRKLVGGKRKSRRRRTRRRRRR